MQLMPTACSLIFICQTMHHFHLMILTSYPWNGSINISVSPAIKKNFTVKLRIPGWAHNKPVPGSLYKYSDNRQDQISLKINGNEEKPLYKNGYIMITRKWERGDAIEVIFPMEVRRVVTSENVKENNDLQAIEYGPFVYCAEEIDNPVSFSELTIPADAAFKIDKREDLLKGVNVLTCINTSQLDSIACNISLVPYYTWSNRGIGKMKVWFPAN